MLTDSPDSIQESPNDEHGDLEFSNDVHKVDSGVNKSTSNTLDTTQEQPKSVSNAGSESNEDTKGSNRVHFDLNTMKRGLTEAEFDGLRQDFGTN